MRSYYFGSRKWILVWIFTALWLLALALGTTSAIVGGVSGPEGYPGWFPYAILAVMWAFGIWLAWFSNQHPCTSVTVGKDGVVEGRATFPFRVVRRRFRYEELIPLQIIEDEYEDGEIYFVLRLPIQLVSGHNMVLAEGSLAHCLERNAAFFAALGQGARQPTRTQGGSATIGL